MAYRMLQNRVALLCLALVPVQHARAQGGTPIGTQYTPVQLDFEGPESDETDISPDNPFLDYRLLVTLTRPTPPGGTMVVPGFFNGNGAGGGTGNIWSIRFLPDVPGVWSYDARIHSGADIGIDLDAVGSQVMEEQDSFLISEHTGLDVGFYGKGTLRYVGEYYYRFDNGEYFLKGGTNSPENLFGYAGFDDMEDQGGEFLERLEYPQSGQVPATSGLHRYPSHVADFQPGDPLWTSNDPSMAFTSEGLIGALNYLSSKHVNSVYFLPTNEGGDGQETTPHVKYGGSVERMQYDISRLEQWHRALDHAQRLGIFVTFSLAEEEIANKIFYGSTDPLSVERRLFYKELSARFGYMPAMRWVVMEENSYTVSSVKNIADYIQYIDPYDHPIGILAKRIHETTHLDPPHNLPPGSLSPLQRLLGHPTISFASLEFVNTSVGSLPPGMQGPGAVEFWRDQSATISNNPPNRPRKWVIECDECQPVFVGLNGTPGNASELRKTVLWDVYLSGGQLEWYFGGKANGDGGDHDAEDFTTRDEMWDYMWYARSFLQGHTDFWELEPEDGLVSGETETPEYGGAEVFREHDETYVIYYPDATDPGQFDLSGAVTGTWQQWWYNPRNGTFDTLGPTMITPSAAHDPGAAPSDPGEDWVLWIFRDYRELWSYK